MDSTTVRKVDLFGNLRIYGYTVVMFITKLVEDIKYDQGISFLSEVESIIRKRIRPKIMIHSGKIRLPSKRSK